MRAAVRLPGVNGGAAVDYNPFGAASTVLYAQVLAIVVRWLA